MLHMWIGYGLTRSSQTLLVRGQVGFHPLHFTRRKFTLPKQFLADVSTQLVVVNIESRGSQFVRCHPLVHVVVDEQDVVVR
ncbi:MAG: hypothetical protein ACK55Z_06110, partial [bacterium]